jgi:uncharacterized membrane protein
MELVITIALIIGTVLITAGLMLLIFYLWIRRQQKNITEQMFSIINTAKFEEMIKRD